MDHVPWVPDWPQPPPDEIRFEAFSSVFSGLSPAIPTREMTVAIEPIAVRGNVRIAQQPSEANGYTSIIEFNDYGPLGPGTYRRPADLLARRRARADRRSPAGCGGHPARPHRLAPMSMGLRPPGKFKERMRSDWPGGASGSIDEWNRPEVVAARSPFFVRWTSPSTPTTNSPGPTNPGPPTATMPVALTSSDLAMPAPPVQQSTGLAPGDRPAPLAVHPGPEARLRPPIVDPSPRRSP